MRITSAIARDDGTGLDTSRPVARMTQRTHGPSHAAIKIAMAVGSRID